ncbi:MAG: HEAT repeat domain-containing protein [Anaerolineae bacterium]|nr:HEAT repeat domain-containing protein [Anaerolineae bacterium]
MLEQLVVDLRSADAGVRFYAAQKLGALNDDRAADALITALSDAHAKVQYAALSSLIKLGAFRALQPVLDMLLDDLHSRVWELLKLSIGTRLRAGLIDMVQRDDLAVSDRLHDALTAHPLDEHQKALFLRMIGRTGDSRRLDGLVLLIDGDAAEVPHAVQAAAAEALGMLGDREAVSSLIAAAGSPNDAVRETTVEALGRLGDALAFETVLAALTDENEWVRRASAEALGMIGDARALDALTVALSDESGMVQDAAFDAIKKLSGSHFTALL